jgi:hypothetical protein
MITTLDNWKKHKINENAHGEPYSLIMHNWNSYIVKNSDLDNRPGYVNYQDVKPARGQSFVSTADIAMAQSEADNNWFRKIEHYYAMPELLDQWGYKSGRGSKIKDLKKLYKGVDFDVTKMDTIQHAKIAVGAPTVQLKNADVAVPVNSKLAESAEASETTQEKFRKVVKGLPTTVKTDLLSLIRNSSDTPEEQRVFFQKQYSPVKFGHVSMVLIDKALALQKELVAMPKKQYDIFYNSLYSDFN